MAKQKFIYYSQLVAILKEYYSINSVVLPFNEALEIAVKRKLYIHERLVPKKRTGLSKDEFLYYIDHSQVDLDHYLNPNKIYKDSSIIPPSLNIYALTNILYTEQNVHPHNCFDIHFVYSGSAILIFEDEVHYIKEGDLCILTPNSNYRLYPEKEEDVVITMYIRNSSIEEFFSNAFTEYDLISLFIRNVVYEHEEKANFLLFKGKQLEDCKEIIQNIYIDTNYMDSYSNLTSVQWLHLLFSTILRDFTFECSYFTLNSKNNKNFIKILDYVQNNYQTITMGTLAKHFHYNESYLSTMFINNLGVNFVDLMTNLKINHSKNLLEETTLSIQNISEIVGYTSVDHFSRTFKKKTSVSPSVYRKIK